MAYRYNVWLSVERVLIDDETGEELDWPDDEDVDEAKLFDLIEANVAEDIVNEILASYDSPYSVSVRDPEEK